MLYLSFKSKLETQDSHFTFLKISKNISNPLSILSGIGLITLNYDMLNLNN